MTVSASTAGSPTNRNTLLIQALATLLIANSHLEAFYPKAWLAADGLLGNSLFFLLSGYGLMCSEQQRSRSFGAYYWRRILRIYPALLLTVLVFQVGWQEAWRPWTLVDYLRHLIYPTAYGYIQQIMVFYVAFFLLAKLRQPRVFLWLAAALCLPYAWFHLEDVRRSGDRLALGNLNPWMWWIFFFQVMLLGGWLAGREPGWLRARLQRLWLILGLAFGVYVGLKFAMVKGIQTPLGPLANYYFLLHILTLVVIVLAFGLTTSPRFQEAFNKLQPLAAVVSIIGGLTLEIYLVHVFVLATPRVVSLFFPVNVAVFFLLSIGLSWLVAQGARWLRRPLERGA